MNREFPPPAIADLDRVSAGEYLSLCRALKSEPCTIAVGAGVSASSGLPSWKTLLRKIASTYFYHWEFDIERGKSSSRRPPRDLSIAFWEDMFWSDSAKEAADSLVATEDALRAAQMIKTSVRPRDWNYLVRKALYGSSRFNPSELLLAIAGVCSIPGCEVELLSYNYDNLVETALLAHGTHATSIYEPAQKRIAGTVPIYYPHGYLKQDGGPTVPIVLGEEDYNEYAVDQYGWQNTVQLGLFSRSTTIFIGFSLVDPHVRRLLWVAKQGGGKLHYAFLPSPTAKNRTDEMLESLVDAQLWNLNVRVIRYSSGKDGNDHSRLGKLVSLLGRAIGDETALWSKE
ncbi:SIR2 family protein [Castellaniella ginsengisoli]|uniref:SIR2 family protein n=1 Tax=Castellaniella ginsengisoli TaxID=546114 RepID=A0AB39D757_9BURK